ncbi:hypothetical protein CH63R_14467 [Colletotrichum higginsianum IMI 349063]|uniref:Uncharacterized protein n=1 Tax=Colletotrichum higginsianum (strain IMI 349063) TaxID=759273 RepID=A0A1B7XQY1_COLHI|nr:hypothetical protein CH63R_14467 [Colletotrichum higginsianum IMI 349063]OBR02166.1 hypothetical protein CH63R_14467 [Colletotrichum higginsianum IMI 349063]
MEGVRMASAAGEAGAPCMIRLNVRHDVPAIRFEERPLCDGWLRSVGFLVPGRDGDEWDAIKKNWLGFLTATRPPERGTGQTAERRGRRAIQVAFWNGADGLEALAERWPAPARRMLTQTAEEPHAPPFESLGPKWLLDRRRRFQSMWTGLVCFLAYSAQHGTLEAMGLSLDQARTNDLLNLIQEVATASASGNPNPLFAPTLAFLLGSIADKEATARTNAILWWTAVLVRSALASDDEGDDFISRGAFAANIVPIDTPLHDRVESMLHYSRVFVLHQASNLLPGLPGFANEIQGDLNAVDIAWLNNDSGPRPTDCCDGRTCTSVAWRAMLAHLRSEADNALGSTVGTPMYEVAQLLARLREVRSRT